MIYIVSGASRSGKSLVAKRMSEKTGVSYISTDNLMMGYIDGLPELGLSENMWPNEIAEIMWPFLEAMISNMIENEMDYIFEGEAFLPKKISTLRMLHPNKIKVCFLGFTDIPLEKKMMNVKKYSNGKHDWLAKKEDEFIEEHIINMKLYSAIVRNECNIYGCKYFDSGSSFTETMDSVIEWLVE